MSATIERAPIASEESGLPWALWGRQVMAILRLELRKNFFGKRAILVYLMALLPVLLLAALAFTPWTAERLRNAGHASIVFAGVYEGLILRTVIVFGCAWIFMNLFRGEVVDRSLHYYFLSPVRREVLVAGKYFSGLVTSIVLFGGVTIACLILLYIPRGVSASSQHLFSGPGLGQALTYIGVTILACIGYGAVFLVVGLFFRNPIVPALALYGWEWINFLLPPLLKKLSVIHYLRSLSPVSMPEGPFAIVAEPTPAWIAIPGLLAMTAVVLVIAAVRIRRMEIRYGSE
jgi:ABC-type transport system involved in multi-copper enzyme maturation permease subunit